MEEYRQILFVRLTFFVSYLPKRSQFIFHEIELIKYVLRKMKVRKHDLSRI